MGDMESKNDYNKETIQLIKSACKQGHCVFTLNSLTV